MLNDSELTRVLTVTAHPDDVDFAVAGSAAHWVKAGVEVTYLIVTDGDAGGFDPDVPRADIPGIRRQEQVAAAGQAGVTDVRFLGYKDGYVEPTLALRRDIARVIRQVRPELVVTHHPDRNYQRMAPSHPDHRAVGAATLDAVYPDARNPFTHPELAAGGLEAWTVSEVWLAGGERANHYSDVTDTFPQKVAALRSHTSQTAHLGELEDFVRGWLAHAAELGGLPEGRLAEPFQVIDAR
ncbi:MAG: PIG-L family deacetylase [Streptosporangiales bacterium]|nr:PIG-L family deacetylase [Streptosporangiales bacterium]